MERTAKHFRKRDAILSCLRGTTDHPSAEWIYNRLKPEIPDISLGTVYRNLGQLCEQGKAIIVETADKKTHYDGCVSEHGHYVCECCGRVFDLESPCVIPEELSGKSFKVTRSSCVYYGICKDCRTKEES